ncbi:hypothetical protein ACFPYJ_32360 [Paenibacillus solisilvae]|uniref:DUF4817 domain-containing protein n=1 Tax=Paenibacillus solisilvae TaxID=2486751 RepID=A0ABW0W6D5_9BACL
MMYELIYLTVCIPSNHHTDFIWINYNEGITLQASVEAYRARFGFYPKSVLADQI